MCSYTSSVMTYTSYFAARSAMKPSSSRVKTLPQGFDGLQSTSAFGCWRKASSSTAGSKRNVGGTSGT